MSHLYRIPAGPASRGPLDFVPTHEDVDALIAAARQHPLGLDYLREGALDNVAVTLKTHAFTVVAARERLARQNS